MDYKNIRIDVSVHGAIEARRQSFSETENDILRRALLGTTAEIVEPASPPVLATVTTRRRGRYEVILPWTTIPAESLKEAYGSLLKELALRDGRFLGKFALQRSRGRRFVALRKEDLYLNSRHLVHKYAALLVDGYWFDTNLSRQQIEARAAVASKVAGLEYGRDVKIG